MKRRAFLAGIIWCAFIAVDMTVGIEGKKRKPTPTPTRKPTATATQTATSTPIPQLGMKWMYGPAPHQAWAYRG